MIDLSEVKISLASPDDVFGMGNVFYITWLVTYPNKDEGITVDDIEDYFKNDSTEEVLNKRREALMNPIKEKTSLVAKYKDEIIGLCNVVRRSDKNQLQAIYVLPEFQGKGIGGLLWEEAQNFFDKKKDIVVEVVTYNIKAIEFYKKLGFVDTGRRISNDKFKMKSGAVMPEMEMEIKLAENII